MGETMKLTAKRSSELNQYREEEAVQDLLIERNGVVILMLENGL
jgi:hypothetical protein